MFVYGVCAGPGDRFERALKPTIPAGSVTLVRRGHSSIFDAYNSILDETARRFPRADGVVLVHDDVSICDPHFEERLRAAMTLRDVGVVGVVGGLGQYEMSWWKSAQRRGHVEHATHVDDFSHGTADVDCVDGLLMALSPAAANRCRLNGAGYPGWHGYDSELCSTVRAHGLRVLVSDLDVFHDCKTTDWEQPELWWAAAEWALRWQPGSLADQMRSRAIRFRKRRASRRALSTRLQG